MSFEDQYLLILKFALQLTVGHIQRLLLTVPHKFTGVRFS